MSSESETDGYHNRRLSMIDYALFLQLLDREIEETETNIQDTDNQRLKDRLSGYKTSLKIERKRLIEKGEGDGDWEWREGETQK